jgi:hypothetical protein
LNQNLVQVDHVLNEVVRRLGKPAWTVRPTSGTFISGLTKRQAPACGVWRWWP